MNHRIPGRNPWDDEYLHRGRLWGGSVPPLPRLPEPSGILELGCGDGKTAAALAGAGHFVTAVDFSLPAIRIFRNHCPDPERVRILVADVRKIPFCNESFDAILASHVTAHLPAEGRSQMAAEVFRLLAPGGSVFFRDFSIGDFRYGQGEQTEPGTFLRKNGIATHYFTEEEVTVLFSGLAVQSMVREQWTMRVMGRTLIRSEIVSELKKPSDGRANATNPL